MNGNKSLKYGIGNTVILTIISLYVESVSSQKVIFIGEFLAPKVNEFLLTNSLVIIISLSILNLLFYILSHHSSKKQAEKDLYNRICKHLFNEFIRKDSKFRDSDCKVSFLKVSETMIFEKMLKLDFKKYTYVSVFGRHQTKQGKENSIVKFYKNEGCAGKAFSLNTIVSKTVDKFDESNPVRYFNQCQKELNLPKEKVIQLNEKSASYLCVPITYFQSDKIIGVISFDSYEGTPFRRDLSRKIESTVKNYQAIFHINNN